MSIISGETIKIGYKYLGYYIPSAPIETTDKDQRKNWFLKKWVNVKYGPNVKCF